MSSCFRMQTHEKLRPGLTQLWQLVLQKFKSHLKTQGYYSHADADKGVFVRHTCRKTGTPNSDPARPCQTSSSKGACIREGGEAGNTLTWLQDFPCCYCCLSLKIKTAADFSILFEIFHNHTWLTFSFSPSFIWTRCLLATKRLEVCAKSTSNWLVKQFTGWNSPQRWLINYPQGSLL